MVKQVILSNCGVLFNPTAIKKAALGPSTVVSPAHAVPITRADLLAGVNDKIRSVVDEEIRAVANDGVQAVANDEVQVVVNDEVQAVTDSGMQVDVNGGMHVAINDEIEKAPWKWWFLELLPVKYEWQEPDGRWRYKWRYVLVNSIQFDRPPLSGVTIPPRSNFWRGRQIRQKAPIFHSSVHQRINATGKKYMPKAQWVLGTESYTE